MALEKVEGYVRPRRLYYCENSHQASCLIPYSD
jgi:hypothetical protein